MVYVPESCAERDSEESSEKYNSNFFMVLSFNLKKGRFRKTYPKYTNIYLITDIFSVKISLLANNFTIYSPDDKPLRSITDDSAYNFLSVIFFP